MKKRIVSSILLLALLLSALPAGVSAEASPTTYGDLFMELYGIVITNGEANGYISRNGGLPYHAVETLYIDEDVDYGHMTTSEDAAWLVEAASLYEGLTSGDGSELRKAWSTYELMIPKTQTDMMKNSLPSATYYDELDRIEEYPQSAYGGNTGINPIHMYMMSAYSADTGLYLPQWLTDTDNTYGFGTGCSSTFINTFARGFSESVYETVPHPAVEELKYGNSRGLLGILYEGGLGRKAVEL